jgi:hypothetical protein
MTLLSPETAGGAAQANVYTVFSQVLPTLLWVVSLFAVILWFRQDLRNLVSYLVWRIRSGAPVKIGSFELGAFFVPSGTKIPSRIGAIEVREDTGEREQEREQHIEVSQKIFLAHRLAPSKEPNQLYNVLIYLITYRDGTLLGVKKVEYYFGKYWGHRIFTSTLRSDGFAIATSAYGHFLCTAKLHFTDGRDPVIVHRFIDFEMGQTGR